jgi:hypothetical protein
MAHTIGELGMQAERMAETFGIKLTGNAPPEALDAFAIIRCISEQLVARGHLKPEMGDGGTTTQWIVARRYYHTTEEFEEALRHYRAASAASEITQPLLIANQHLLDALGKIWLDEEQAGRKVSVIDRRVVQALVTYRNALWMMGRNLALRNCVLQLDGIIGEIVDRSMQILVGRLFRGKMTAEQGEDAIAMLKQAAETGAWRDPERDIERAIPFKIVS